MKWKTLNNLNKCKRQKKNKITLIIWKNTYVQNAFRFNAVIQMNKILIAEFFCCTFPFVEIDFIYSEEANEYKPHIRSGLRHIQLFVSRDHYRTKEEEFTRTFKLRIQFVLLEKKLLDCSLTREKKLFIVSPFFLHISKVNLLGKIFSLVVDSGLFLIFCFVVFFVSVFPIIFSWSISNAPHIFLYVSK